MSRIIYSLPIFEKRLLKLLRYNGNIKDDVRKTIGLLEKDVFIPSLKTHKLHGSMSKVYACSVNYDFRIIFSFDSKYVYLESIGTHDEVY